MACAALENIFQLHGPRQLMVPAVEAERNVDCYFHGAGYLAVLRPRGFFGLAERTVVFVSYAGLRGALFDPEYRTRAAMVERSEV